MNPVDELPTAEVAVEELLERSSERGFVLLSELQELYVPELHGTTWLDDAVTTVRDHGVQLIDDVADDATLDRLLDEARHHPLAAHLEEVVCAEEGLSIDLGGAAVPAGGQRPVGLPT